MKLLKFTIYTLFLVNITTVYGWIVKTDTENKSAIHNMIDHFSTMITQRCNFTPELPIYVPLNDSQLIGWLEESDQRYVTRQYLLLKPHYHIDKNIILYHRANFCGLSDWLDTGLSILSESLDFSYIDNIDSENKLNPSASGEAFEYGRASSNNEYSAYGSAYGSASDCNSLITDFSNEFKSKSCQKRVRTKLSFTSTNQYAPSLILLQSSEFRHLDLYQKGTPSRYGLLSVGCSNDISRRYCNAVLSAASATFKNVIIEDQSGYSDFLLRVDDRSYLYADNIELNFKHKKSSKVIDIYWVDGIQISNSVINNYGRSGIAIDWDGVTTLKQPNYITNTTINSLSEGNTTGLKLTYINSSPLFYLPELSGITINSGVNPGFDFGEMVNINQEGNNGNILNGDGLHCRGAPYSGILEFNDGVSCTTSNPVTTTNSVTTTAPSIIPENQSGAMRTTYNWGILASAFVTLFTVRSML